MTNYDLSEQERARQLVHREVQVCLSHLVTTMAQSTYAISTKAPLSELLEQAFELASPIPDYEEAAIQAGWTQSSDPQYFNIGKAGEPMQTVIADSWQELCRKHDIEPYEREVYEFWAVSGWFGRKLRDQGEKVDFDFANLTVWARTTTGQAIYCDGVVERIVRDLWKPEPVEATSAASSPYEIAARKQGWQWDEGGSHFYRNRPGASAFEPYEYVHTPDCDWAALCLETGIDAEA